MSKHEIEFKALVDKVEAIEHLEKIIQCLKAGKIVIEKGDSFLSISPKEKISFELCCSRKKDKEKISFELSWTPAPPPSDPENRLTISFNDPEVEKPKEDKDNHNEDLNIR
jgi:amphi-Trp domain-containing protein